MKQTVLVTGASSGIGMELAERFAQDGSQLILVARNEKKLKEIAERLTKQYQVETTVLVKDLSDPKAPDEIFQEMNERNLQVDVLVNNAGFGVYGLFAHTELERELDMITVNIRALTHLTKLFLPAMMSRGAGGILNVASLASFQPGGPLMAVYYATKAYVLSFTMALETELKGTGVKVSALCPGPTETGFGEAAEVSNSKIFQNAVMHVDPVVDAGYKGFKKGKVIVIPGIGNRLLAFATRLLPRRWVTAIVRKLQEEKAADQ